MTMSFEMPTVDLPQRSNALARRLLGGAGAASLDAYRLGECLPFIAHGVAGDGSLVVAARSDGALGAVEPGLAVDVRLDIVKRAPDPSVPIVAASLHLLGSLTWVTEVEAGRIDGLPPLVSAMTALPGVRLGVIDIERVVLHDMSGATPIELDQLGHAPAAVGDEYAGFELVSRHDQATLKDVCWSVMVGATPGIVVSKAALPNVCPHNADKVFCVDVDALGITLMLVGSSETLVVFAAFGAPAESAESLRGCVSDLMYSAALAA